MAENRILAASYVRMSTEHQKYSTRNQMDVIRSYAEDNEMEIVASFADHGKSGLTLKGRAGLSSLLTIVNSGQAPFSEILVFDISRWGRFQDTDESAYYEYQCKLQHISIHYCSEPFVNDGSPIAAIMKSLKRAMASEYSRELSNKVFAGQCRSVRMGYRQGGASGYGLRRMSVNEQGKHVQLFERHEHKNITSHRIVLVPGPKEEVDNVLKIYDLYINKKLSVFSIVKLLNKENIKTDRGTEWTESSVTSILKNEKYIGTNVFNKVTQRLKSQPKKNNQEKWIKVKNCFEPAVPPKLFQAAQKIFKSRTVFKTNEELILDLKKVYKKHGYLTRKLLYKEKGIYCPSTYCERFGSLVIAYDLAGYNKKKISTCEMIEGLKSALSKYGKLSSSLLIGDNNLKCYDQYTKVFGNLENAYLMAGYFIPSYTKLHLIKLLSKALQKYGRLSCNIINNDPALPSTGVIAKRFGSISNAFREVGYKAYNLAPEEMVHHLKLLYKKHGKLTDNIIYSCPDLPSPYNIYKQLGSRSEAYKLAGCKPTRKTDQELLEDLIILLKKEGYLSRKIIDETKQIAHSATYLTRFGGVLNAYKIIGYKRERISKKILIEGLKRILKKHGKITNKLIDDEPSVPSREYYIKVYGSLTKAYKAAGFKGHYMSDEEMLNKLKKLLLKEGRLSKTIITKTKGMPSGKSYGTRFGGVLNAYKLIGYVK